MGECEIVMGECEIGEHRETVVELSQLTIGRMRKLNSC